MKASWVRVSPVSVLLSLEIVDWHKVVDDVARWRNVLTNEIKALIRLWRLVK